MAPFMRMHPNAVSGLAVVCAAAAALMLYGWMDGDWRLLAALPFLFLRIAFNAMDGLVAQARSMTSPRGEMVNEFSDRVNDAIILGALAFSGIDARIALGALVVVLLVSYMGILPRAAGGERRYDGPAGKADRMFILGLGCIAAYVAPRAGWIAAQAVLHWTLAAMGTLGLLTIAIRWTHAWRQA